MKDVAPKTVMGGNPAKEIRKRFDEETIYLLERVRWWDWPAEKITLHLELQASYDHFSWLGKRGMAIALFLIGSNTTLGEIKKSGPRSFALGITLWVAISVGSLFLFIQ